MGKELCSVIYLLADTYYVKYA